MKKLITSVFIAVLITGCAPKFNYSNLDNLMNAGDCRGSLEMIEKNRWLYGFKAELLYLLDSAMVNMSCNNYKRANSYFHDAEELAATLWTKSISQGAASMLTNDMIINYPGEDFERALINLFSAFSYIRLNDFSGALTECRRLDLLLTEYNDKYEKKNTYKEDALGRYISGILSEADGEYSEAYIFYYEAFKAYRDYGRNYGTPMPGSLVNDLLRISNPADKWAEARHLLRRIKKDNYVNFKNSKKMGSVVFIHFNGKAPIKVEKKLTHYTGTGPINIAFPEYVIKPLPCQGSTLTLESDSQTIQGKTVLAEDINQIARKNLEDRKTRIWTKTLARAILKQAVAKAAADAVEKEYGETAGIFARLSGQIAANATEKADIRVWRTLPAQIYISRVFVPEGTYSASVEECGGKEAGIDTFSIKARETKFLFYNSIFH